MDSANIDYLKKNLKYLGFGNSLNPVLEAKIKEGLDKFSIGATAQFENKGSLIGKAPKDLVHYELFFSKSKTTDNYFINALKATLEKGESKDKISNTFYLGRGNDVTAKEAYNLLSERSILKTVEIFNKYNLHHINDHGVLASELKVASIPEAKETISSRVRENEKHGGYYQVLDHGYPVREFDLDGKDITSEPSGKVVLIHEYLNQSEKALNKAHYSVEKIGEVLETIEKIVEEKNPYHETMGFGIYNESGKILLFSFDKYGREVDISPEKRKENVWIKLDLGNKNETGNYNFKKFYENYGFNLERELEGLGIRELSDDKERKALLSSLGRGNIQIATFGSGNRIYLEADPQFKKVNIYDTQFNRIGLDKEEKKEGFTNKR